jgi:hypothetical protein
MLLRKNPGLQKLITVCIVDSHNTYLPLANNMLFVGQEQWLMSIIPATLEAEIGRIKVQGLPR